MAEKYEDIQKLDVEKDSIEEYIVLLRSACDAIFEMFDGIFGEGTSNLIFGGECDFEQCLDAYKVLQDSVAAQSKRLAKKVETQLPNRATRRTKQ